MEFHCPFTRHRRYRVRKTSAHGRLGEILRFDTFMIMTNEDDSTAETMMYAFTDETTTLPRLWFPQAGENIKAWQEYFEEIPDDRMV